MSSELRGLKPVMTRAELDAFARAKGLDPAGKDAEGVGKLFDFLDGLDRAPGDGFIDMVTIPLSEFRRISPGCSRLWDWTFKGGCQRYPKDPSWGTLASALLVYREGLREWVASVDGRNPRMMWAEGLGNHGGPLYQVSDLPPDVVGRAGQDDWRIVVDAGSDVDRPSFVPRLADGYQPRRLGALFEPIPAGGGALDHSAAVFASVEAGTRDNASGVDLVPLLDIAQGLIAAWAGRAWATGRTPRAARARAAEGQPIGAGARRPEPVKVDPEAALAFRWSAGVVRPSLWRRAIASIRAWSTEPAGGRLFSVPASIEEAVRRAVAIVFSDGSAPVAAAEKTVEPTLSRHRIPHDAERVVLGREAKEGRAQPDIVIAPRAEVEKPSTVSCQEIVVTREGEGWRVESGSNNSLNNITVKGGDGRVLEYLTPQEPGSKLSPGIYKVEVSSRGMAGTNRQPDGVLIVGDDLMTPVVAFELELPKPAEGRVGAAAADMLRDPSGARGTIRGQPPVRQGPGGTGPMPKSAPREAEPPVRVAGTATPPLPQEGFLGDLARELEAVHRRLNLPWGHTGERPAHAWATLGWAARQLGQTALAETYFRWAEGAVRNEKTFGGFAEPWRDRAEWDIAAKEAGEWNPLGKSSTPAFTEVIRHVEAGRWAEAPAAARGDATTLAYIAAEYRKACEAAGRTLPELSPETLEPVQAAVPEPPAPPRPEPVPLSSGPKARFLMGARDGRAFTVDRQAMNQTMIFDQEALQVSSVRLSPDGLAVIIECGRLDGSRETIEVDIAEATMFGLAKDGRAVPAGEGWVIQLIPVAGTSAAPVSPKPAPGGGQSRAPKQTIMPSVSEIAAAMERASGRSGQPTNWSPVDSRGPLRWYPEIGRYVLDIPREIETVVVGREVQGERAITEKGVRVVEIRDSSAKVSRRHLKITRLFLGKYRVQLLEKLAGDSEPYAILHKPDGSGPVILDTNNKEAVVPKGTIVGLPQGEGEAISFMIGLPKGL